MLALSWKYFVGWSGDCNDRPPFIFTNMVHPQEGLSFHISIFPTCCCLLIPSRNSRPQEEPSSWKVYFTLPCHVIALAVVLEVAMLCIDRIFQRKNYAISIHIVAHWVKIHGVLVHTSWCIKTWAVFQCSMFPMLHVNNEKHQKLELLVNVIAMYINTSLFIFYELDHPIWWGTSISECSYIKWCKIVKCSLRSKFGWPNIWSFGSSSIVCS